MDKKILVRKYVTSNFDIVLTNDAMIKERYTGKIISLGELSDDVDMFFNTSSMYLCRTWYNHKLKELMRDIYEYLGRYRLILGSSNWMFLDKNDDEFLMSDMIKNFDGVYEDKLIKNICTKWKYEKINKRSEEIILGS